MSQAKAADKGKALERNVQPKKKVKKGKKVQRSSTVVSDPSGGRMTTFKGYDLVAMEIPEEALPYNGVDYKGQKSYTINMGRESVSQLSLG